MENAGFPMLWRAAVNAFICVISRVIKNCRVSMVPWSSVKLSQTFVDDFGAGFCRDVAAQSTSSSQIDVPSDPDNECIPQWPF